MVSKIFSFILILTVSFFVSGCNNHQPAVPKNITDNVNQHVVYALKMVDRNDIDAAKKSIKRALELNPKSSIAWSTKAVIEKDFSDLDRAKNYEDTKLDNFFYYISAVRISNSEEELKKYYKLAQRVDISNTLVPYYNDEGALDFFAGKREFELAKYKEAKRYFANVYDRKYSKFKQEARKLWKKTDRIIRGLKLAKWSLNAKKIAAKDIVKRVDAAVILVDDLHLEKLLKGAFNPYSSEKVNFPSDIENHPNRYELEIVYRYHLRGLNSVIKDGKIVFAPNDPITREEFAMVLEDIISKYKKDPKYKIKYFGSKSPFIDVKSTSAGFNAIMNAVSEGFMKANIYGQFRPKAPLSGIELIEAITKIKEELSL